MTAVATTALAAALALPAAAAPRQDRVVHRKGSGSTVRLAKGAKLTVRLTECAPCGYVWRPAKAAAPSVLAKVSSTYVNPPGGAGTVGGAGTRVIVYRAKRAGSTSFSLHYVSPSQTTAGTFSLKVKVH